MYDALNQFLFGGFECPETYTLNFVLAIVKSWRYSFDQYCYRVNIFRLMAINAESVASVLAQKTKKQMHF